MSGTKRKYSGKTAAEKLEVVREVDEKGWCKSEIAQVYVITLFTLSVYKKLGFS
jgi:hypothetical protein